MGAFYEFGDDNIGCSAGVEMSVGKRMAFLSGLAWGYDRMGAWAGDRGDETLQRGV